MTAKQIKVGKWYETTLGYGLCVSEVRRGTVMINIVGPLPRGNWNVRTRDVLKEIEPKAREIES